MLLQIVGVEASFCLSNLSNLLSQILHSMKWENTIMDFPLLYFEVNGYAQY